MTMPLLVVEVSNQILTRPAIESAAPEWADNLILLHFWINIVSKSLKKSPGLKNKRNRSRQLQYVSAALVT